jgi:hypothetical protein
VVLAAHFTEALAGDKWAIASDRAAFDRAFTDATHGDTLPLDAKRLRVLAGALGGVHKFVNVFAHHKVHQLAALLGSSVYYKNRTKLATLRISTPILPWRLVEFNQTGYLLYFCAAEREARKQSR